jgi:hypothetical protein
LSRLAGALIAAVALAATIESLPEPCPASLFRIQRIKQALGSPRGIHFQAEVHSSGIFIDLQWGPSGGAIGQTGSR